MRATYISLYGFLFRFLRTRLHTREADVIRNCRALRKIDAESIWMTAVLSSSLGFIRTNVLVVIGCISFYSFLFLLIPSYSFLFLLIHSSLPSCLLFCAAIYTLFLSEVSVFSSALIWPCLKRTI